MPKVCVAAEHLGANNWLRFARLIDYGPHGMCSTEKNQVNSDWLAFAGNVHRERSVSGAAPNPDVFRPRFVPHWRQ